MPTVLLALIVTAAGAGDVSDDHIAWWKRHLRPRTLVRYGACGPCSRPGGSAPGTGYDYRVEFDYPWYLNRRRPTYRPAESFVNPIVAPPVEVIPKPLDPPALDDR